jgi:phenylalanyl-tRNA synthetase beta chain
VEVVYGGGGGKKGKGKGKETKLVEPTLTSDEFEIEMDSTCKLLGIELTAEQMDKAAVRMGLKPLKSSNKGKLVKYEVSPVRPDILHACDVAEEIGIGYGFNNIPMVYPPTNTVGAFIPENKFTDLLRHELAQAGYIETLTCALVSLKENYDFLRYEPDLDEAVTLSNPKTIEYEMVRTSLIPGLLKTLQSNQNERLPQRLFEISDTAKIDNTTDTGAKNHRKICIMQLNTQASFEVLHGTLGLLMTKIGAQTFNKKGEVDFKAFSLQEHAADEDKKYFPMRGANVLLGGQKIGTIGVLHPEVLDKF